MEEIDVTKIKNGIRGSGLNITQVATKAGVGRTTAIRGLNKKSNITINNLNKLIKAWNDLALLR